MNKQQLANRIWAAANKMRSKIEANDYKDFILGLIFYKYLSDKEEEFIAETACPVEEDRKAFYNDMFDPDAAVSELELGDNDKDYSKERIQNANEIRNYIKGAKGYCIFNKYLFSSWIVEDKDKEKKKTWEREAFSAPLLSEALDAFSRNIEKPVFRGIFKVLRDSMGKLGENEPAQTHALKDLIGLVKDIPTKSKDYDVLGYIYEYLISNFAASAGKKAGEFYTPHEVSQLMAQIVASHHKDKQTLEIYDPTSGSGSLLITIGKYIGKQDDNQKIKYYAQELKENTYNLTRMNLVMRGIHETNIFTRCADSLEEDWPRSDKNGADDPLYVDAVVSNPPYSQHWNPTRAENDARFKSYGLAPKSKADYAFLLHELFHVKPDGIMTIVLPHGVLFRGGEEETIRKNLVEKNNIDTIIGLPANIFFGTGIPTIIMVLKREMCREKSNDVLIIDASRGFMKDGKQNRLRECDIKRIVDAVAARTDVPGFARCVTRDEIRANAYNLNIPRYVSSQEESEKYDIYATMFGGLPNEEVDALAPYWSALPTLRAELFCPRTDQPYSDLRVEQNSQIIATIEANEDVVAFRQNYSQAFAGFDEELKATLIDNYKQVDDLRTLAALTTNLFGRVANLPLVDKYAVYQQLANHWRDIITDIEIMQSEPGAACAVEDEMKIVKKKDEENEVASGRKKGRIIPFRLVQETYFVEELKQIESLQAKMAECEAQIEDIVSEFTQEETEKFCDAEKDNALDKKLVTKGTRKGSDEEPETLEKLKKLVAIFKVADDAKKRVKVLEEELNKETEKKITNLTPEEVTLLLRKKWIEPLMADIMSIANELMTGLEQQITSLSNKYALSYKQIEQDLDDTTSELSRMVGELTGDEFTMLGLKELIK